MVRALRRHGKRRDDNEPGIVRALRRVGAKVYRLESPDTKGIFDLLVGFRSATFLLEVKRDDTERVKTNKRAGREGLDSAQWDFKESWTGGPCEVVTTPREALEAIGYYERDS